MSIVFLRLLIVLLVLKNADLSITDPVEAPIDVDISDIPFQVSINVYGRHVCGGSILNEHMVLTALHCTAWGVVSDIIVRAGTSDLEEGGQDVAVKGTCTYSHVNELEGADDVQILILDKPLDLGVNVRPIQLDFDDVEDGAVALVSGWNLIKDNDRLQKVLLRKQDVCSAHDADNSLSCFNADASNFTNVKTGGPLIVNGKQVGLDAYGRRNPCDDNRGLYVMLKKHRSFITKCMSYRVRKNQ